MVAKINIIITSIALIIIIALACLNSCNNTANRNRLESANSEIESLKTSLSECIQANKSKDDVINRINAAYSALADKCSKATEDRDERESKIDTIDHDWLVCELPDGVQDLFK